MPSNTDIFFRSIRFKAILWYIVILTITLSSFSLLIYGNFRQILYGELDDLLSSRAGGIVNSVDTYRHTKSSEIGSDRDFAMLAREWVEEKRKDPELMSIFVQILDARGEPIISSRSMPRIGRLSEEDLEDLLDGEESFDTVAGEAADGRKMRFRVYAKPVMKDDKAVCIVQVAGPVWLVSLALNNLVLVLFVLLPLTILLAAIPGFLLVRLTLRPVDSMVNTLRQITAENLKLKIHIPDTKDEIRRLADAFNDMIERLERSFSSQQRFIEDISEELKYPMKVLKDDLERALEEDVATEKEFKTLLARASKEIGGFSKTIEDLVALSQLDSSQSVFEIKRVNLTRLIEGVFKNMTARSGEKGIEMSYSCPEKIIMDGDECQLRQVFINLLDNAIKYTLRKGAITVSAARDGEYAKVTVSDTGIGMPEDELPYIFDRFYQVAGSRGAKGGFGLGLSSAKAIAEEHKGTIAVASEIGKGSTFTVRLPLSYPG